MFPGLHPHKLHTHSKRQSPRNRVISSRKLNVMMCFGCIRLQLLGFQHFLGFYANYTGWRAYTGTSYRMFRVLDISDMIGRFWWSRFATVLLCVCQSVFYLTVLKKIINIAGLDEQPNLLPCIPWSPYSPDYIVLQRLILTLLSLGILYSSAHIHLARFFQASKTGQKRGQIPVWQIRSNTTCSSVHRQSKACYRKRPSAADALLHDSDSLGFLSFPEHTLEPAVCM